MDPLKGKLGLSIAGCSTLQAKVGGGKILSPNLLSNASIGVCIYVNVTGNYLDRKSIEKSACRCARCWNGLQDYEHEPL